MSDWEKIPKHLRRSWYLAMAAYLFLIVFLLGITLMLIFVGL